MFVDTPRYRLRMFSEDDRLAFVAYQSDPRYLALYGPDSASPRHAHALFDRFLSWTEARGPNRQVGVFDRRSGSLIGCAGLRREGMPARMAEFGLELAPDMWGRFAVAVEVTAAVLDFGFGESGLQTVIGTTASENRRVERIARWFGASVVERRTGPRWMTERGWDEVVWALTGDAWKGSPGRHQLQRRELLRVGRNWSTG
ncbi:GNAT family N-acetyltransferase [Rhodoplanes elegans]|nr:GNAT family protein [Rhodoplanes elegans]